MSIQRTSWNEIFNNGKSVKIDLTAMEIQLIRELAWDYAKSRMTSFMKENHSVSLYKKMDKIMKKNKISPSRFVSENWEHIVHALVQRQCIGCRRFGKDCTDWIRLDKQEEKPESPFTICGMRKL